MRISSVGSALPEHSYEQGEITARLAGLWSESPALVRRLAALHANTRVERRHLALPLEQYGRLAGFGAANDAWIRCATDLGQRAVENALARAGIGPREVDAIFFSTVTGLAAPSLDVHIANRLGFRPDVRRAPLFGLGCVAGAAAVSLAADHVRAHPEHNALVLTVELCSLTLQLGDHSVANLISTGLFGDGAAAAVVSGERSRAAAGPRIEATRSVLYPGTEDAMGWTISEAGFRIVLSPDVPELARARVGGDVDRFLAERGLARADLGSWVCHPGGPRVLEAVRDALGVTDEDLAASWECLRRVGNLSSASVLLVLEETVRERRPAAGTLGLMAALGPGFCAEYLLLAW